MTSQEISTILDGIADLKVLIMGDIMLDRYLYGTVDRISPEAPVPVLDFTSQDEKLGGAGNVAANVKALGATVEICSIIGRDDEGEKIMELLHHKGLATDLIVTIEDRPTTLKTRVLGGKHHLLRVDREEKSALPEEAHHHLLNQLEKISWEKYDLIILQDYDKGFFSERTLEKTINAAKKAGCYISVDPKITNFWNYRGVDLIKPNKNEASSVLGRQLTEENLKKAAIEITQRLDCKEVLITLGSEGNYYYNKESENEERIYAESIEIADVCGAGDAVISVAAPLLATSTPVRDVLEISNKVGAYICLHVGVTEVNKKALLSIC